MNFLDENFLLTTKTGIQIFHDYAKSQPIIDYHCHLNPQEIAENKRFSSIAEMWLSGDHYKWRAMRSFGIKEALITGEGDERTKFRQWARTLPWCIGNPLYHWTHLELQRYFGISQTLNENTEEEIWNICNEQIKEERFSSQGIINRSNVEVICTTDDPCDDLKWHDAIAKHTHFETKVFPTFRPDQIIHIDNNNYIEYIRKLSIISNLEITSWDTLQEAIKSRVDFFHEKHCRLSDHALQYIPTMPKQAVNMDKIIVKALTMQHIEDWEINGYKIQLLIFLASLYENKNWTMQLHIGALRNVNSKKLKSLGIDTGFDVIADHSNSENLSYLLDCMESKRGLPKTIVYNLNPKDNFIFATMIGAFQESDSFDIGKMQFGPGWWYNDQKDGMIRQLTDLGNLSVLGKFIGMLTDSRSFLSYPRHEYFRRIFCNLVGTWVDNGEYPNDQGMLKKIIEGVSYNNAKEFFNFK